VAPPLSAVTDVSVLVSCAGTVPLPPGLSFPTASEPQLAWFLIVSGVSCDCSRVPPSARRVLPKIPFFLVWSLSLVLGLRAQVGLFFIWRRTSSTFFT